ncbi:MAG: 50S ribosomal protein L6 [Nanoarchaeota archaeon]
MAQKTYSLEVEVPEGVTANVQGNILTIKGPKGEVKREIENPRFSMKAESKTVILALKPGVKQSQRDKMHMNSYQSHIKNLIDGVIHGYTAKLKVCSGHFPMTVTIDSNGKFAVKNFLGEKVPRTVNIKHGVKVEIQGDILIVTGLNKELVGQTAADLEQLTRITNRDRRIFQDGIYITKKPGEE